MRSLKNCVQEGEWLRLVSIYVILLLLFAIRLVSHHLSWDVKRVIIRNRFMKELSHPGVGEVRAVSILLRR